MSKLAIFLNSVGLMEAFKSEVENIGNDEVQDIFEGIKHGEYHNEGALDDEHWIQWDCSVSGTDWAKVSERYETYLKTGNLPQPSLEEEITEHFDFTEEELLKYENIIADFSSLLDIMAEKLSEDGFEKFKEKLFFDLKAL